MHKNCKGKIVLGHKKEVLTTSVGGFGDATTTGNDTQPVKAEAISSG